MAVKIIVESEGVFSSKPARVLVYEDNCLVTEVVAKIELKQGADGGYYHCVDLTEKKTKNG